jgi:hypothetical protein
MASEVTLDLQERVSSTSFLIGLSSYFGMEKVCTSWSENLGSNKAICQTEKKIVINFFLNV